MAATLTIASNLWIDFSGSTIQRADTFAEGELLQITGTNVMFKNLRIDSNGAGKQYDAVVRWQPNSQGIMKNCHVTNSASHCIIIKGDLTAYDSSASYCSKSTYQTAWRVSYFARFRAFNCIGDHSYTGFFLAPITEKGCHLDVTARHNHIGVDIRNSFGTSNQIHCDDNDGFGVIMSNHNSSESGDHASDWSFGTIVAINGGVGGDNPTGTGFEIMGGKRNRVGTFIAAKNHGYSLAIARSNPYGTEKTTTGASHNSIGNIQVDWSADPAIHFSGGSSYNSIGNATIRNATMCVVFGEDTFPRNNDFNSIGHLYCDNASYGAIFFQGGSHNSIGRAVLRNCKNQPEQIFEKVQSLIEFQVALDENWAWLQDYIESGGVLGPNTVADNVVGFVDHIITNSSKAPRYIVRADAQSKNNRILGGITRGHYWQSAVTDSGQSNIFNLGDSTSNLLQNGGMDVAYYGKTVVTAQGNDAGSGDPSTTPDTAGIGWKSWLNSPTPSYTQTEIVSPSRLVVLSGNPSTRTHSGTGALYVETQGNKGQGISARSASNPWWSGATNPHPGMHALWTDEKAGQKLKLRGWLMPITDHLLSIWLGNNAQGFNIVKVNKDGGQNGQWIPFEVVGHNSPAHLDTVINIYTQSDATAPTDRVVKFVVDSLTLEVMP